MDCEKFEATMLDELYGELDELTLAASRRHMGGCARCAALMGGLRATRKVATLPVVAPSPGFEERLLAAVGAAEAKPQPKLAQVISWAGRWAMRPQTAMAAVFLLILGTSSLLFSRRAPKSATEGAAASFTVTENGAPAAPIAARATGKTDDEVKLDPRAAAAAHGAASPAEAPQPFAMKPSPATGGAAIEPPADEQLAPSDGRLAEDSWRAASPRAHARPPAATAPRRLGTGPANPGPGAIAGATPRPTSPGGLAQAEAADLSSGPAEQAQFATPPPASKADDAFGSAKKQYSDGDYAGAVRTFDGLAATGDATASLWAARSARDGAGGCSVAAARFDQVAAATWGTTNGYDATLEGAQCYARLGQGEAARSRYERLLTVASYAARAQAGIKTLSLVAAKARQAAARPAAAAPAVDAPAAPPAAAAPAATATGP